MNPTRRRFLEGLGALVIAVGLPGPAQAGSESGGSLNAFVGIATDGTVRILCPAQEMGQGASTGLAQVVADELDAAWSRVVVLHADEAKAYRFTAFLPLTPLQMTGGSVSMRSWYTPLRQAGAAARAMLVEAAARQWGVGPEECTTRDGVVRHPDGHEASYGELAEAAAQLDPPRRPTLKSPEAFSLIATSAAREDLVGKVTGQTEYGIDVRLPGMVRACTVSCPIHGGAVATVDDTAARAMPGVLDVLVFDHFVAVIAKSWWPAKQAADALQITWDDGGHGDVDSASISRELHEALEDDKHALTARKQGKAEELLDQADTVVEATYEVPYLEHATMEPLNCTVHLQRDRCDVWVGSQGPTRVLRAAREITGLPARKIHVHTTYLGGGFGRRGNLDWVRMALEIATRVDGPVQMLWSREETTRIGRYRPVEVARFRAGIRDGKLTAMRARVAGENSGRSWVPRLFHGTGAYKTQLAEGLMEHDSPYVYNSVLVDVVPRTFHIDVGYWRSVGQSYSAFFRECFLDEVAHAIGTDPVALRRSLIAKPRILAVLDRVVQESGWGRAPEGHYQGIGLIDWMGSYCAQVVEIAIEEDRPRVQKLTAALDCGIVVNPDQVRAQVMGGAIFGLSSAMGEAITVAEGRVQQSNFHDYQVLRMNQSPFEVDVHLMDRPDDPPTGVGEPGTPPAIGALCNAIYAATGKRVRRLPLPPTLTEIA